MQHLAEQRRLLVAGDARRSARLPSAERRGHLAVDFARGTHLRQHARAARRAAAAARRPTRSRVDVEQHRARGVAGVGDVQRGRRSASRPASVSTVPNASSPASARARAPGTWSSIQAILRAGEVGVDDAGRSARGPASRARRALSWSQSVGGAAVLPDDGVVDRLAGRAVPDDGRLALVGDADRRRRPARRRRASRSASTRDADLRRPDLAAGRARPSPAAGRSARNSCCATADDAPSWSKTMARELVVPWSRARKDDGHRAAVSDAAVRSCSNLQAAIRPPLRCRPASEL